MTQEEKQLLLKDLCMRLPYGVKLDNGLKLRSIDVLTNVVSCSGSDRKAENIKPYLRPMSNMTEEERYTYRHMLGAMLNSEGESIMFVYVEDFHTVIDWLLSKHFDYRGLIEKGLALEAPEDMYKTQ